LAKLDAEVAEIPAIVWVNGGYDAFFYNQHIT
jgi:hypothetical protein